MPVYTVIEKAEYLHIFRFSDSCRIITDVVIKTTQFYLPLDSWSPNIITKLNIVLFII